MRPLVEAATNIFCELTPKLSLTFRFAIFSSEYSGLFFGIWCGRRNIRQVFDQFTDNETPFLQKQFVRFCMASTYIVVELDHALDGEELLQADAVLQKQLDEVDTVAQQSQVHHLVQFSCL